MQVGSLSSSAINAMSRGFASMERAAETMSQAVDLPEGNLTAEQVRAAAGEDDPLISGVMDMSVARLQVGVGTALMRTYRQTTGALLDMLA